MKTIAINDRISYVETSDNPLSADIGIIKDNGITWLFDVGNGENSILNLTDSYNVVLSHFHLDHTGNIGKLKIDNLYQSKETYAHTRMGTIINSDTRIGNLHIFTIPSSHAKGCLGLEVDDTYAFVGDALYSKVKDGYYIYNTQLLKAEIDVLKKLQAPYLLVSHLKGLIKPKAEAITELEAIYSARNKNIPVIKVPINKHQ